MTQNTGEAVAILGKQFGLIPPQYIHGFFTKPLQYRPKIKLALLHYTLEGTNISFMA